MKRRIVSMMLVAAMVTALLAGWGGNTANSSTAETSNDTAKEDTAPVTETAGTDAETGTSDEGKVLNIYCWNEEFKSRLTDHYPGYTEVDATTGTIGDVTVKWNNTPNDDNAYQNNLDATLLKQADAAADDKIDIFLVEADYALKYVDTDYTMAVSDLGITDSDLSKQYQYTKDVVTDSNGVLKGVSWQGCPGVLFYNRDAAKAVLGSDDPSEVQNYVKDWDTFNDTAKKMKDAGYKLIVVNNQAGVARGYYTEEDVKILHQYMNQLLEKEGAEIDAFYYCPHHPVHGIGAYKKVCNCRKPGTGMFEKADKDFPVDRAASYMIGDKPLDTEAGQKFGVTSILVGTGYGAELHKEQQENGEKPPYVHYAADLEQAAQWILERKKNLEKEDLAKGENRI